MVKEFDSCIILTDNLKERKVDDSPLLDGFDAEDTTDSEEDVKVEDKKFYQLEVNITYDEDLHTQTFVVHTFNVDKAMMLITNYLNKKEQECEANAIKRGNIFEKREIHTQIESAKPIPVGCFISREFSMAYME